MFPIAYLRFSSTIELWVALTAACAAIAIAIIRRTALPTTSKSLIALGTLLLALACGAPEYLGHRTPQITVIIDTSASMRGATSLDRARLQRRLHELLPNQTYSIVSTDDVSREQTQADAVVLFSDARFDLPSAWPATYVVVDPALENPSDGAITQLSVDGDAVRIAVRNQADANEARRLAVDGVQPSPALPVGETLGSGSFLFRCLRDRANSAISARIIGGDRWPENDRLDLSAAPSDRRELWWISDHRAPPALPDSSWRAMRASELPLDATAYLAASVIVLDDAPASSISPAAQQRIAQYVRDLGGTLIIGGGEHAFGAGGYFSSTLDALSPLASAPPSPTRQWILLLDSSGSMATTLPGDAQSKWQHAVDSMLRALQSLPVNDLVTIGSFARDVRWWSANRTVTDTRRLSLPPPDVIANGPTNIEPSLAEIVARAANGQMPTEVLILSDADAKIDNLAALVSQASQAKLRMSLLATGPEPAPDNPVVRIVRITGGQLISEANPANWSSRANDLLRAAIPELLVRGESTIIFDNSTNLRSRTIALHNRTWPKADVQSIAKSGDDVMAARWNVGAGSVLALGFPANVQELARLTEQFASAPRDPKFIVRRDEGSQLRISVDAIDNGKFLNGLALQLAVRDDSNPTATVSPFTQTAPGQYERIMPAPRTGKVGTIVLAGRVIDRFALAGRYDREFDAIGNDRDAMRDLAQRTGGRVVQPSDAQPLKIAGPERRIALTSEFAFTGAALIAMGLIHWRRSS